jgi:uncharacterized protein YnzC (UPF0291/DUF896 family)
MISIPELIQNTIDFIKLDLTGFTVLTEAASGNYAVTPIIALMANADKVIAITSNSKYATANEVISQTRTLEKLCKLDKHTEIHTIRNTNIFSQADIITNLGFVRPLDHTVISVMKPTAVIPYMCEGWEFRETDIDINKCNRKGIPVLGTNEQYPLDILSYCGNLCIHMMHQAKIDIPRSRILIVSNDKFRLILQKKLKQVGLFAKSIKSLKNISKNYLQSFNVLIISDYTNNHIIIGSGGDISPQDIAKINPSLHIIQFAGINDVQEILKHNIHIYPETNIQSHRMAITLSELGPKPIIELHTLGLKVGEFDMQ